MLSLPCLQVNKKNALNSKADSREDSWDVMVCKNYDRTIVINDSKGWDLWRNIRLEIISWGFIVNKVTETRGHLATFYCLHKLRHYSTFSQSFSLIFTLFTTTPFTSCLSSQTSVTMHACFRISKDKSLNTDSLISVDNHDNQSEGWYWDSDLICTCTPKIKPEILMSFWLYSNSIPLTLWPLRFCCLGLFFFNSIPLQDHPWTWNICFCLNTEQDNTVTVTARAGTWGKERTNSSYGCYRARRYSLWYYMKDFNLLQRRSHLAVNVGWWHLPACMSCALPYWEVQPWTDSFYFQVNWGIFSKAGD